MDEIPKEVTIDIEAAVDTSIMVVPFFAVFSIAFKLVVMLVEKGHMLHLTDKKDSLSRPCPKLLFPAESAKEDMRTGSTGSIRCHCLYLAGFGGLLGHRAIYEVEDRERKRHRTGCVSVRASNERPDAHVVPC